MKIILSVLLSIVYVFYLISLIAFMMFLSV